MAEVAQRHDEPMPSEILRQQRALWPQQLARFRAWRRHVAALEGRTVDGRLPMTWVDWCAVHPVFPVLRASKARR